MSREAHVRICERLGSLAPFDSTAHRYTTESISIKGGTVSEG